MSRQKSSNLPWGADGLSHPMIQGVHSHVPALVSRRLWVEARGSLDPFQSASVRTWFE